LDKRLIKRINKLKVFHGLVNYGSQAGIFARELRDKGIDSISVTGYDPFKRKSDIILRHGSKNIFQKSYNYLYNCTIKILCFFRFNVFHFYYGQTLTSSEWDLPFYRIFSKKVFFHYLGADVQQYRRSVEKYKTTNVVQLISDGEKHDKLINERLKRESRYADLQLVCAPYLLEFVPGAKLLPLAIDLNDWEYHPKLPPENEVFIMHAPTSREDKGTSIILKTIEELIGEGFNLRLMLVEQVIHEELKSKYIECDIFIDQILSGWYGTCSVEAMATGRPVMCFLREEFCNKYLPEGMAPLINVNIDNFKYILRDLLKKKDSFPKLGSIGREFVSKIHNSKILSENLITLYNG
jgi:glycosyltransferase involved in cell wall biosynthesis